MTPAPGRPAGTQCGGHSLSRDHAGPSSRVAPRQGRRASRPAGTKVTRCRRRDAGKFVVSPARERADTTTAAPRPRVGPFRPPTAYSPGGEILLHAQQPLAQGLQHRVPSLRPRAAAPSDADGRPRPASPLSFHAAAAAPSASPPPPRARPAQPQCRAQGRLALRRGAGLRERVPDLSRQGEKPASRCYPEPAFSKVITEAHMLLGRKIFQSLRPSVKAWLSRLGRALQESLVSLRLL